MEPLGSFPRVLNVLPREKIEGPPRNFLKVNPRPHPRPDQRPKTRGAAGPEGFWPLFWPRMWPRACLQYISYIYISYGGIIYMRQGPICRNTASLYPNHDKIVSGLPANFLLIPFSFKMHTKARNLYPYDYQFHFLNTVISLNKIIQAWLICPPLANASLSNIYCHTHIIS